METSTIFTITSVIIAIGSLVVAYTSMKKNDHRNDKNETKENVEIHSKLQSQIDVLSNTMAPRVESIDNGIRDLKAERRIDTQNMNKRFDELKDELRDVHTDAKYAIELAKASHRRLDAIDAPQDPLAKK